MSHLWSSPFHALGLSNAGWAENNADQRAGTAAYGRNDAHFYQFSLLMNQMGIKDPYRQYLYWQLWGSRDLRLIPNH